MLGHWPWFSLGWLKWNQGEQAVDSVQASDNKDKWKAMAPKESQTTVQWLVGIWDSL